jgi:hypothetical protein
MKTKEELLALSPTDLIRYIMVAAYMDAGNESIDELDPEATDYQDEFDDMLMEAQNELLYSEGGEIGVKGLALRAKVVYANGGGEGGGDHVERVLSIIDEKDEAIYHLRITGFYSSYNGTDWDDEWEEVEPYEVTVTKYKKKKAKKKNG